ncbi:MAG: AMP nucleosidase [Pseudomonadota bacterium]
MANKVSVGVHSLKRFDDPDAAMARIADIYDTGVRRVRERFDAFVAGDRETPGAPAYYPYVMIEAGAAQMQSDSRPSYGTLSYPGAYGTTLTRPDLFGDYYREQIALLIENHGVPVSVGVSDRPIPLPFVIEHASADLSAAEMQRVEGLFHMPDLAYTDDAIANGTHVTPQGQPWPLALFTAERVDLALHRLRHYTASEPENFQQFVLFTNYQRYVDEFIDYGRNIVADSADGYTAFIEPGGVIARTGEGESEGVAPAHLPQMPAYHLTRADRQGITLVNIGVGPSNAKTITDHLAVLRPHCWMMIGHCGGLRRSQQLGDYVLAHAYIREDHVLDQDLPVWVPVPPIAEVQVALQEAVARITGLHGREMKTRMRTGTVATSDNRNWELRYGELFERFSQSRAIAVDMESATIAANGFRLRVPYGTLLCVSDKPMHGEIKLPGMANAFYNERISQHLKIGLEAVRILREGGVEQLHSRKLRSFDEPAFR